MLGIIYDITTRLVKRIILPGLGEKIHSSHVQRGEAMIVAPRSIPLIDLLNAHGLH